MSDPSLDTDNELWDLVMDLYKDKVNNAELVKLVKDLSEHDFALIYAIHQILVPEDKRTEFISAYFEAQDTLKKI